MPQLALPNYSALGSIVKPTMSRRAARTALYDAGWEFIGGGSFASTWASPDGSRVAKVTKPDRGQRALIKAAQKHPDNPHLPTVYGFLPLKRGGFVVEMERLGWDGDYGSVSDYDGSAPTKQDIALGYVSRAFYDAWHAIDAERKDYAKRGQPLAWDLHDENVMFRPDGTPVLLDPLYEPRAYRRSANADGTAHDDSEGLTRSHRLAA